MITSGATVALGETEVKSKFRSELVPAFVDGQAGKGPRLRVVGDGNAQGGGVAGGGRHGHRAVGATAADLAHEAAGVDDGAPAVGAGAGERQPAGAGLGEAVGAGVLGDRPI